MFAVNPQQGQPEEQRKEETNEDIVKLGCGLLQQVRGLRAVQLILNLERKGNRAGQAHPCKDSSLLKVKREQRGSSCVMPGGLEKETSSYECSLMLAARDVSYGHLGRSIR